MIKHVAVLLLGFALAIDTLCVDLSTVFSLLPGLLTLEFGRVIELFDDLLLVQLHLELLIVHGLGLGSLIIDELALLVVAQANNFLEVPLTIDQALLLLCLSRCDCAGV